MRSSLSSAKSNAGFGKGPPLAASPAARTVQNGDAGAQVLK